VGFFIFKVGDMPKKTSKDIGFIGIFAHADDF